MKYVNKYLPLFGLMFFSISVQAQQIAALGVVLAKGSDNRIDNARIINLRSGISTLSNGIGLFSINAHLGDTLQIVKEDFYLAKVVVASAQSMMVPLVQRNATMLQEVTVYENNRVKSLQETQKTFNFYPTRPSVVGMILNPISGIYQLFGKTPNNQRHFQKYLNNEIKQSDVDTKFNRYLVEKYTPLRNSEVDEFMFRYRPDFNIAQNWNLYKVIDYIKAKYQLFAAEKQNGTDTSIPKLP